MTARTPSDSLPEIIKETNLQTVHDPPVFYDLRTEPLEFQSWYAKVFKDIANYVEAKATNTFPGEWLKETNCYGLHTLILEKANANFLIDLHEDCENNMPRRLSMELRGLHGGL